MNPSLRSLVRRVAPDPAAPPVDDAFVAQVRRRLGPLVEPVGFVFAGADAGRDDEDRTTHATVARFEIAAETFVERYPGAAGHLRSEGAPLELWAELDADRCAVRFELESWHLSALLAAVRSGPGAPARRRHLDDGAITSLPPEAALDRAGELLQRLFDAAAPR